MKIRVNYTTQVKAALGLAGEDVELPDASGLPDLLRHLKTLHTEVFSRMVVDQEDRLMPSVLICVGDQQVRPDDDVSLSNGDVVTLLSAISGG